MFRISSYASKIRNRIKQSDIEEDPQSLSAKAFRRRLLEEDETADPLALPVSSSKVKVAVYRDRSSRLRRSLIRFGLVVVAPLLALGLIFFLVFNIINDNRPVVVVETESVALDNIPVPGGVQAIARAKNLNQQTSANIYFGKVLPTYNQNFKGAATYLTSKSRDDIKKFYDSKLVEPKPPPWQTYGNPTTIADFYTVLYLRSLPNGPPGSIEALVLQIEPVRKDIMQRDPDYYGPQAKEGQNVIVLWKTWLAPK
jgi:hypothetical protein